MVALVLRVYDKGDHARAMMRCAMDAAFAPVPLSAEQVATLLQQCGLSCMSIFGAVDVALGILQEQADDGHLVLCGMRASDITPYPHWSVLRETHPDGPALIQLSDHDGVERSVLPMGDLLTGHFVVLSDTVPKNGLARMYADMRE